MFRFDFSTEDEAVTLSRDLLRKGYKRDDVYHAIVRFAAMNRLDRYALWLKVVE